MALIHTLKAACGMLSALRFDNIAHYGYSAIYKLQYWQGVVDALGGIHNFHHRARQWTQGQGASAIPTSRAPGPTVG
jgi:hypothetical protein